MGRKEKSILSENFLIKSAPLRKKALRLNWKKHMKRPALSIQALGWRDIQKAGGKE